jgi:hypothetical protein
MEVEKKKKTHKKNIKFDALEKNESNFMTYVKDFFQSSKDALKLPQQKKKNPTPYFLLLQRRIKSLGIY